MGFAAAREVTRWEDRRGFSVHCLFNRPFGAVVLDKAMILQFPAARGPKHVAQTHVGAIASRISGAFHIREFIALSDGAEAGSPAINTTIPRSAWVDAKTISAFCARAALNQSNNFQKRI